MSIVDITGITSAILSLRSETCLNYYDKDYEFKL